jgi:hypothetical protein
MNSSLTHHAVMLLLILLVHQQLVFEGFHVLPQILVLSAELNIIVAELPNLRLQGADRLPDVRTQLLFDILNLPGTGLELANIPDSVIAFDAQSLNFASEIIDKSHVLFDLTIKVGNSFQIMVQARRLLLLLDISHLFQSFQLHTKLCDPLIILGQLSLEAGDCLLF